MLQKEGSSKVAMSVANEAAPYRGHVAPKWRGTQADQADMSTLGREQVLRVRALILLLVECQVNSSILTLQRNFRFVSIVGFGCTLIATWEVILTYAFRSYF